MHFISQSTSSSTGTVCGILVGEVSIIKMSRNRNDVKYFESHASLVIHKIKIMINTPFFADYNDVFGKLFANLITSCGKFHYIQIAYAVAS